MSDFVNRDTLEDVRSVDDETVMDPPWLLVLPGTPNQTIIDTVVVKYRKISGDVLSEMSQVEKDAVDQADADARNLENRELAAFGVDGDDTAIPYQTRELIERFNQRDNYLTTRVAELQQALLDIKASQGTADAIRDAIPANFLPTNTRPRSDVVQEYKADILSGGADAP